MVRRLGWIALGVAPALLLTGCAGAELGSVAMIAVGLSIVAVGAVLGVWLARLDSGASAGEEWLP